MGLGLELVIYSMNLDFTYFFFLGGGRVIFTKNPDLNIYIYIFLGLFGRGGG